ncbi:hypothetical protein FDECE_17584 [Fusarium decemcellulare]|nr:hypothetical protein FDECE_17584 [Fusarium decemcellulare]
MSNQLLAEFHEWLNRQMKEGVNGHGEPAFYVPPSQLKRYWTEQKVRDILHSCDPPVQENANQIATRFLRIFSVLVHIEQPQDITMFIRKNIDDHQMPRSDLPSDFPAKMDRVLEDQWMFCPLEFTHDQIHKRELHALQILPVTYEKMLREESPDRDAARVWKVRIHPDCNSLIPVDAPIVFKVYEGPGGKDLYAAEANVYSALPAQNSITKYFGSFSYEETDKRIIMLEYAAGGSLLDFLRNTGPPVTPDHFFMLWERLLGLLDGIYALHNQNPHGVSYHGQSIAGYVFAEWNLDRKTDHVRVHQDIQLANILVFPRSDKSPFDVTFKLTDFGMAEVRRVLTPEGAMAIRNEGNRMYSAPECYPNYPIQGRVRPHVSAQVDIWALGAVLSDVFVWSIAGETGREDYRRKRKDAIANLPHIEAKGFDACFHDGEDRLKAVDEYHAYILQHRRASDPLSPCISQIVLDGMLTDHRSRLTAIQTKFRADKKIKEIQQELLAGSSNLRRESNPSLPRIPQYPIHGRAQTSDTPPQPIRSAPSPTPRTPQSHKRTNANQESSSVEQEKIFVDHTPVIGNPSAQSTVPPVGARSPDLPQSKVVSVDKVHSLLEKKKRYSLNRALDKIQGKQPEAMDLLGMQEARSRIKERKGRDQIMLVDNCASMETHMKQVAKTARVISYVAKVTDDNGMDLYFASDPTQPKNCSSSRAIESAIKAEGTVEGECNMFKCLHDILESVWENGLKPTSIYVYTDGVWESDDDHQVDILIKQSIKRLVDAKKLPSTLMFQFIQFGNDEKGTKRLQDLDDNCTERHELGD